MNKLESNAIVICTYRQYLLFSLFRRNKTHAKTCRTPNLLSNITLLLMLYQTKKNQKKNHNIHGQLSHVLYTALYFRTKILCYHFRMYIMFYHTKKKNDEK